MKRFPLVIACPVMKNNKNLSMIARSASCFGVSKMIITGQNKIDDHISRNCDMIIEKHHTLLNMVSLYKRTGWKIWVLEQAKNSISLDQAAFKVEPALLVIGNECKGVDPEILALADKIFEIKLYGLPHSLNVAMATTAFLYEYAKQVKTEGKSP